MSTRTFCDSCKNEVLSPVKYPIIGILTYRTIRVEFTITATGSSHIDLCKVCTAGALGEVIQNINTSVATNGAPVR